MSLEPGASPVSAGQLLKSARERQGVHIAALAAALKVPPRKLDALERDRLDELGDPTFARALAQSVCRVLHMDPQPVLALLPRADPGRLEQLGGTLNAPFRERPSRDEPVSVVWLQRALVGAGGVLLIAALFTYFLPSNWLQPDGEPSPAGLNESLPVGASAASPDAAASPVVLDAGPGPASQPALAASAAAVPTSASASASTAVPPAGTGPAALRLVASGTSWVEVRDRDGRVLLSRTLHAGESADLDARVPMRVVIGNASAVQVSHRGQAVPLGPATAANVARLELP